jgi:hypothetical protein
MTTVRRSYIRPEYEQKVDDGCLEYKSIPMAVVNKILKVSHSRNDYTGIKQVYNLIPPRPKDLITMATSIARINNLPYSSAVPTITKKLIDEEIADVRSFVGSGGMPADVPPAAYRKSRMAGPYMPEQPIFSSSGARLVPTSLREGAIADEFRKRTQPSVSRISTILGIVDPTSGVDMGMQTEWIMNKERGFMKRDVQFGQILAEASGTASGMMTQTLVTKPPSGRVMTNVQRRGQERFFESPEDRFGTITGTPTRQLSSPDRISRVFGEHFSRPSRFAGDSATSGLDTPEKM